MHPVSIDHPWCFYNFIGFNLWYIQLIGHDLEKAHTWLYKVPQLTVHVRAKTKTWGRRKCPYSSKTGLCWGTALGKVTKNCLQHWRSTRTPWPPSFLNGRSLEPPRLFLELAAQPNWAIGVEGPWSGRWPRTPWALWQSSRVPLWRWENLPEVQPSLQHSTNQAFMVEWPDGNHDSPLRVCQKAPKGLTDHEKQDSLIWGNQD